MIGDTRLRSVQARMGSFAPFSAAIAKLRLFAVNLRGTRETILLVASTVIEPTRREIVLREKSNDVLLWRVNSTDNATFQSGLSTCRKNCVDWFLNTRVRVTATVMSKPQRISSVSCLSINWVIQQAAFELHSLSHLICGRLNATKVTSLMGSIHLELFLHTRNKLEIECIARHRKQSLWIVL